MQDNQISSELTASQRQVSMNCAIAFSSFSIIATSCVAGNVFTLLAIKLGAKEMFLGILSFFAFAPYTFGIFTMSAIERVGKRKVMIFWYSITTIIIIPLLFLPILSVHWTLKSCLLLLLLVTLFRSGSDALGSTGWFPLLQDVVPEDITGQFFGRMRTWWQSISLATIIFAAWLLRKDSSWWRFEVLFILALFGYIGRVAALFGVSEKKIEKQESHRNVVFSRIMDLISKVKYRHLLLYIISYTFAAGVCEPFRIKMVRDMGYSAGFTLAGCTAMVALGAIVSLRVWGKISDKFGNRAIFSICLVGMMVVTFIWILVDRTIFGCIVIFSSSFFWGVFHSGNGIAQIRYMFHTVPKNKQNLINIVIIILVLTWGTAPLAGGFFLTVTRSFSFSSGAIHFNNYILLFVISALLFLIPFSLRHRIKVGNETAVWNVLAYMGRPIANALGPFMRIAKKNPDQNKNP